MNNIPENEKLTDLAPENEQDLLGGAEFSTVFSAPLEHKKKASDKRKKNYILPVTAGVLAVALLGTSLWLVKKYIPVMEGKGDNTSSLDVNDTVSTPLYQDIIVKELASDSLACVTLTNESGKIKFYSTTKKVAATSSSSATEEVTWHIDGVDDKYLSATNIESFISMVSNISATNEVEGMTDADCGFDKPAATAEVEAKDGTKFTVLIGKTQLAGSYYCKVTDTNKIYLVPSSYTEPLMVIALLDFSGVSATPAFQLPSGAEEYTYDDGSILYFDKLTVKGANFDKPLVFTKNQDAAISTYIPYLVSSPEKRLAKNVEMFMTYYNSGIEVSSTYAFGATAANLKKYGLDNPDLETTIEIKGEKLTYKFKLQEDGFCAVIADGMDVIAQISPALTFNNESGKQIPLTEFLSYTPTDYYGEWIALYNIDDLSNFTATVKDKKYSFDITKNPDTESEDGYIVKLNGEKVDCSSFQNLYQVCISMRCSDFEIKELTEKPEIVLEFTFNKENFNKVVVEFTRSGASKYQYSISGMDMGKTTSSEMNLFISYLEKLAAGEIIEDL